jgi:hypothetical protein
MTEERDPILQQLFTEARQDLDDEVFTARVMQRSRFARYQTAAGWLAAALILVVGAGVLFTPLQEFALLVGQGLTTALIDLGDGWWALVVAPINSVASVLVLLVKGTRMAMTKIRSASYA